MKISVMGAGYVGLVSGVCLAEKGHEVTCVDLVKEKIDQINDGVPPIYERGLADLLKKNVANMIYLDLEVRINLIIDTVMRKGKLNLPALKDIRQSHKSLYDPYVAARNDGKDFKSREWGLYPHTMIGLKRLNNIEMCVRSVLDERNGEKGKSIVGQSIALSRYG